MAGSIADLCGDIFEKGFDDDIVDPITFCTAEWGLGLGRGGVPPLYPTQRFLLKCYYNMPLGDSELRDIYVKDKFNEKVLYVFNEKEFFDYLRSEERINVKEITEARLNLHLVIGRRGSKTSIVSFIVAYELYKLLKHYSPQEYYNILPEDTIEITSVSTGEKTSKNFYDRVTGNLERAPFFKQYMLSTPNKLEMFFQTQRDIDKYGKGGRASIKISAAACNAKGLRGPNNIFVVFDEAAFFFKDETGKKASSDKDDKAIYAAITPSIAKFKNPDGTPAGRVIMISSPADRSGLFYEEYERSFNPTMSDLLMFQIPTWEMDPTMSSQFLRAEYFKNPVLFNCEYGANFSDRLAGWIDDAELVRNAVVPGLRYKERSLERVPHFVGVDIGLKNDGTAVVVGHLESELDSSGQSRTMIQIDLAQIRYAKDEGKEYFKPEEMADWISEITGRFYVVKGLMDQYYGMAIIPELEKRNVNQYESRKFNDTLNSEIYQNLLTKFVSGVMRLPEGDPDPNKPSERKDSELVAELLTLQATQKSKYVIRVSAPERDGSHDDLSDALARCVLVATEYMDKGYSVKHSAKVGTHSVSSFSKMLAKSKMAKIDLNRSPLSSSARGRGGYGLGGYRRF